MIYPPTPKEMDREEVYETDDRCKGCKVPDYLQREYCSIGICAKELE